MKRVFKQWLAGLLSVVLLLTLLPATALAEEADGATGRTAAEHVQALIDELPEAEEITAETRADVQAQIDAIDAAMAELTGDEAAALDTARYDAAVAALLALDVPSALEQVQALIDELPDAGTITADNRADVEAQLTVIDEAKSALEDEELDELDVTRYMAAVEALLALDDMAGADEPRTIASEIPYIDANGGSQTQGSATDITNGTTEWNDGWYVVSGDVTISSRITVSGNVNLILEDSHTLTAQQGISVNVGNSLTIYCQSGHTGTLVANNPTTPGDGGGAAIGADRAADAGSITINGGNITATVTTAGGACIGMGGWDGAAGSVTVNNGYLKLTGNAGGEGPFGAGGTVAINGGIVEYSGSTDGTNSLNHATKQNCIVFSGNSGQMYGNPTITGDVTIPSGKTLTVPSGSTLTVAEGATLTNEGSISNGGNIVISNTGKLNNKGSISNSGSIEISDTGELDNKNAIYNGGNINISGTGKLNNGGTIKDYGTITGDVTGTQPETVEVNYLDWDQITKSLVERNAPQYAIPVEDSTTTWDNNWYFVIGDVTISNRITVKGTVHLILMDDCTLTAQKGISVNPGNSLTIYGQSGQSGSLSATAENDNAGIGGDETQGFGTITINGGIITAITNGPSGSAGIGGGGGYSNKSEGGTVTINGGNVTATGNGEGAGIGGGYKNSNGVVITINGGTVVATAENGGSGIGSGNYSGNVAITINGGTVTATGGSSGGAGIGGGTPWNNRGTDKITININGGTVTANASGYFYAGIGRYNDESTNISFSTGKDGNAVIVASKGISDKGQQNNWSGIIIEGNTGKIYGTPTPKYNFEIPSGKTLDVENGHPLRIADGVTMTNKGTINIGANNDMEAVLNNEGSIINEGKIDVWGLLTHGEDGIEKRNSGEIVYHFNLEVKAPTFAETKYGSQPPAQTITIKNNGQVDATITDVKVDEGDFVLNSGKKEKLTPGTSDTSWTIQPKTNLSVGTHTATITVTYSGSGSGTSRTATAEVTFIVTQATPTVNVNVSGDLIYGSDITLTAEVTASGVDSGEINDEVTFKAGTVPLGTAQAESGTATLEIAADNRDLQHKLFGTNGENVSVTAEYAGNSNIKDGSGTKPVTIKPKALTYTVTAEGREYDGGKTVDVALKPGGLVGGDVVTLTATGTLSSADAGTYETVNLSDITKTGEDEKYYSVTETNPSAEIQNGVTISPKVVTLTWKLDGSETYTVDYTGAAHTVTAEVTNKALVGDDVGVTVEVRPNSGAGTGPYNATATEAGSYTATATELTGAAANNYTLTGCDNTAQGFTIQKVAVSATTEPAANTGLTYSGTEQALVTEGSTTGGTVMYALGDESHATAEYSDAVPTGTNAGTYYVWWKVVGDANHKDTEPQSVTVTIGKGVGIGSVTMKDYLCEQEGVEPEPKSDTNGIEHVTYTYAKRGEGGEEPLSEKPTKAGEYTVKAEFAATDNYNAVTATADFKITHKIPDNLEEGEAFKCECNSDLRLEVGELTEVPSELSDDYSDVDTLIKALAEMVDTGANYAVYDVKLEVKEGGEAWHDAPEGSIPASGITVTLPYPAGTNSNYTFTVVHMFASGANAGQTETPAVTNTAHGITFTVTGLSPICVGWTAPPSSSSSYYNVTIPSDFEGGSVTSDRTSVRSGSKVTLTVKPDEGYHFGSLTVTNRNGKPVELTNNGDGTYTFTMPYGQVTVAAEFVKCGSLDFTDLDASAWYHDYTDYVIAHGLMQGTGGGLFAPDGTVNRAQMVTVLWNMSGKPVVNYYMTYSDVTEGVWYSEAIRWATSEGIVGGYGNGKFGPNDPITREQIAVMMYRYEQKYGEGGFTGDWMYRLPFTDLDQISDWAFEPVAWCNMKGVIKGKGNSVFDPKGLAKRSELAAVLTRFCEEVTAAEEPKGTKGKG